MSITEKISINDFDGKTYRIRLVEEIEDKMNKYILPKTPDKKLYMQAA